MNIRRFGPGRSAERGAAMVEAAVVMPVIIIFFGLLLFVFREYTMKQEQMQTSRHRVFQDALTACLRNGAETQGGLGGMASGITRIAGDKGGIGADPALVVLGPFLPLLLATFKTTSHTEKGVATNSPLSTVAQRREISTTSYVYCNPANPIELVQKALEPIWNMANKLFKSKQ